MINKNDHKDDGWGKNYGRDSTWTMSLLSTLVFDFAFAKNLAFQFVQVNRNNWYWDVLSFTSYVIGERDGHTDHNIAILLGPGK